MSKPKSIAALFLPNRVVSPAVMRILIVVQAAVALAIWWSAPFKVLPRPDEVVRALATLWRVQGLSWEVITSLSLNLQAIAWTIVISLLLSYLTVIPFFRPIAAAVSKGRFLGLIGLTLIFTLMIGGGHALKLALLVFGMSVFFVTSMAAVIQELPREAFDHARSLGMSEFRIVWEVVVLGTAADAFEVLRQNAAIGWMMLTMVEGISRAQGGLGAMLLNQNKHFHLAEVFAIQLLILAIGILQDYAIGALRRICCPYADLLLERR
jgi:NitT/TauT family transport system permease protein